jgi:hypothetical protein
MAASIWSGPAEVVAHGTVTSFGGHGIYLELPFGGRTFAIGITFREDPDRQGPAVDSVAMPNGVRLDLVNFDGPDGRGSAQPSLVGEAGDDLLMWHFRVFRYGRSVDRTLHFTFFRVPKADVGWSPVVRDGSGG